MAGSPALPQRWIPTRQPVSQPVSQPISRSTSLNFFKRRQPQTSSLRANFSDSSFLTSHRNNKNRKSPSSRLLRMFSVKGHQRQSKVPRPQRTAIIFECLKRGIRECIVVKRAELEELKGYQDGSLKSCTGFHYDLDKQIKITERYTRKLEFHLAKIEEFQDKYIIQQRLREGARNMIRAYEEAKKPAKDSLQEAKNGYKESTQIMCLIEGELETLLGTWYMKMKGISGFARLCTGDNFEVTLKYGLQKWKCKGKVEKDQEQTWDSRELVLSPLVGEILTVKVVELKGIGHMNSLAGIRHCDVLQLYSAHLQVLTIDINDAGTLKLNLEVQWSPFPMNDNELSGISMGRGSQGSQGSQGSRRPISMIDSLPSPGLKIPEEGKEDRLGSEFTDRPDQDAVRLTEVNLEQNIQNLKLVLETYRAQYPQLDRLDQQLFELEGRLKNSQKRGSDVSLSIENALKSFDFLNSADLGEDTAISQTRTIKESLVENRRENSEGGSSTEDAGIGMSPSESPVPLSSGHSPLDTNLAHHMQNLSHLISCLGSYGPLKSKETITMAKVQTQLDILDQLIDLIPSKGTYSLPKEIIPELADNPELHEFWANCSDEMVLFYTTIDSFLLQLELKFGAKMRSNYPKYADRVFHRMVVEMCGRPLYLPSHHSEGSGHLVTLHQYWSFFSSQDRGDPAKYVTQLTKEFLLNESLELSNQDIIKVLKKLPKAPLPRSTLRLLALLLLNGNSTIKASVSVYLELMSSNDSWKAQAVPTYQECLEEADEGLRQAGCVALGCIMATQGIERLLYLYRCDTDDIKRSARDALLSMGEEGQRAYEEVSSSSHPYDLFSESSQMTTEL